MPRRAEVLVAAVAALAIAALSLTAYAGQQRPGGAASVRLHLQAAPVASAPSASALSGAEATARTPTLDPAWVARTSARTGVPAPAVRAYGEATLDLGRRSPGCHLGWTTLAGIGWVESQHGTLDGRTLLPNGRSDRPVVGPALDGDGFAAVPAEEGTRRRHGDVVWDHAVGPMQFIGSTWRSWAADGDGDGEADPADLDDAALAAGRYLCASGGDLATAAGWTAAVLSYNHDRAYALSVAAAARAYA